MPSLVPLFPETPVFWSDCDGFTSFVCPFLSHFQCSDAKLIKVPLRGNGNGPRYWCRPSNKSPGTFGLVINLHIKKEEAVFHFHLHLCQEDLNFVVPEQSDPVYHVEYSYIKWENILEMGWYKRVTHSICIWFKTCRTVDGFWHILILFHSSAVQDLSPVMFIAKSQKVFYFRGLK